MLSYQHSYHAGNAADVHKHALLAVALDYMTAKPKPLSYIETHSGRALYDLTSTEAQKTGEAAKGINLMAGWFQPDHPYSRALKAAQISGGPNAYPGSPHVAQTLLRDDDKMTLAELHPQEVTALRAALNTALPYADVRAADGPALALSMAPPTPRRGMCLIDPSYEVKSEWETMPALVRKLHRAWNVGVVMLWYPLLRNNAHKPMVEMLDALNIDGAIRHHVTFPPARQGHGMQGSGLFIVNPPWGWSDAANDLAKKFAALRS
jgi:23S rRNA (adenine2030-N6)-methyltransferase